MKALTWLALIIAIIALILGWVAFNRTGVDVETMVQDEVEEAINELRADLEDSTMMEEDENNDAMMEDDEDAMMEEDETTTE